ncbi:MULTISPECIES: hypothetical protein [unclassified Salinivibrio]|uniref:hypothetical protein n=1 Tax=unclassified Salinivibrio TaxID=2636825 RepID=UPI00128B231A|nr:MULTISPECIES: hypothetical protein [unclassified Salinivibrio]MPS32062.1 hypothetical protein [Salinivibrio sp. VYel7]MPX93456.1 hypothetical protein [Salinivibrio sp. VYel9]MPX95717.1 hypothetical protein [Salinivibrio sp. VYel6]MPX99674.1 hypothetical protein [Salinivibrio sp. VYel4]MPY02477.1 hypothetical protein [Salinivibrio sp. VYel5]
MGWLVMIGILALTIASVVAVIVFRQRPDWRLHQLHELRALLQHAGYLATQPRVDPYDYQRLLDQTRQLHHLAPHAQKPMYRLFFHHLHALPQYDDVTQAKMKNRALQHLAYLVDEAIPPVLIACGDDHTLSSYQQIWYAVLELLQARQRFSYASIQLENATPNAHQSLSLQQQILTKRLAQLRDLELGDAFTDKIDQVISQLDDVHTLSLNRRLALAQQVNAVMLDALDTFLATLLARFPTPEDDIFNTLSPINDPHHQRFNHTQQ